MIIKTPATLDLRSLPVLALLLCGTLGLVTPSTLAQDEASPPPEDDLAFWEELAFWEAIKDSDDPAEYEAYLAAYPEGRFADLARLRIDSLRAEQVPEPPAETAEAPEPAETPAAIDAGTAPGTVFQDCPDCPAMVVIPAGEFQMGSSADTEEQPVHPVAIPQPFALSVHEISNADWDACLREGGCRFSPDREGEGENYPVSNLSWDDAREYVAWLSDKTGETYRLPSEAEWEYAARAGTDSVYWWGDDPQAGQANCQGCDGGADGEVPVGSFNANPFGLHDVHGNLWEWTADCWNDDYEGAPTDGEPWTEGDCIARVLRGGAWRLGPEYMRSARRYHYDRDVRYYLHGLRVARELVAP